MSSLGKKIEVICETCGILDLKVQKYCLRFSLKIKEERALLILRPNGALED